MIEKSIFRFSKKMKHAQQLKQNKENQDTHEKQANEEDHSKKGLVSTPVRGFKGIETKLSGVPQLDTCPQVTWHSGEFVSITQQMAKILR